MKIFNALAKDSRKLQEHYHERTKDILLLKSLYEELRKETKEGVVRASEAKDQLLTKVDLQFDSIQTIEEDTDSYIIKFRLRVITDGPVVIPKISTPIYCNKKLLNQGQEEQEQDSRDSYDEATNEVYEGYWVEVPKEKLNQVLGQKKIEESQWIISLEADYPGHFKDIKKRVNISADILETFKNKGIY